MTKITLSTKTFSKQAKLEVLNLLPATKSIKKLHVAGLGYVHFFKDENLNILGKVSMERGQAQLMIN
jgi:hypothetical protein